MSRSRSHSKTRRYSRNRRSRSRSGSSSRSRSRSSRYSSRKAFNDVAGIGSNGSGGSGGPGSHRPSSKYGSSYDLDYRSKSSRRSHSRSPMSGRRRHQGNREQPPAGRCLGIFGLSLYTQEKDLKEVFSKYGELEDVQIVYDAQSSRSRGFAFIYYQQTDDALTAKEKANGIEIDGRKIRVDFSITQRAHTPTPGIYMGRPSYNPRHRRGGGSSGGGFRREYSDHRYARDKSPSPYYKDRKHSRSRSRSRSFSPPIETA